MTKKTIRCPDHKHEDVHASAVIFTRADGSRWLHCKGCHANRVFAEGEINMQHSEFEDEGYSEITYGTNLKQCLNEVELLESFEEEKGISAIAIYRMDGFVTDEGYLGFRYGKGREVYRNLLKNDKPRFINEGGKKGLMGDDILDMWDEVFLVEGLTDYISFRDKIATNVVCSFGAELSEEQAYLLKGKTIFILFDRDFAGYKGSKQVAERLKEYGAIPIIIELPNGISKFVNGTKKDVNYLIHTEKEDFKKWLESRLSQYKAFDDSYLEIFKQKTPLKFYKTDIPDFEMTEGLYLIGGQPGVGKTTTGISLTDRFAEQGGTVLYCNYDLPKDQIIARLASRFTNFGWSFIEANPQLLQTDHMDVEYKIKQRLKKIKIANRLTIDEIKYCKKYYTHIIIDYLQRVPNYNTDQRVGLEKIVDDLSDLASNEGKVIVGISRESLNGNRYSGSAALLYHAQAALYLSKTDKDVISCEIEKNTRGETGHRLFKVDYQHQKLKPTGLKQLMKDKEDDLWDGEK